MDYKDYDKPEFIKCPMCNGDGKGCALDACCPKGICAACRGLGIVAND